MATHLILSPPLATLPDYPSVGESVLFQLNGLIVVFLALGSIWGMLELMGVIFRRSKPAVTPPASAAATSPAAAPTPASTPACAVPPEIIAVISAAVHVATAGQPHRIAAIVPANAQLDWAREGRRTIFASHKTR
jgi:Oxaloacetate decarboxylase, gamma chain.